MVVLSENGSLQGGSLLFGGKRAKDKAPVRGGSLLFGRKSKDTLPVPAEAGFTPKVGFSLIAASDSRQTGNSIDERRSSRRARANVDDDIGLGSFGAIIPAPAKVVPIADTQESEPAARHPIVEDGAFLDSSDHWKLDSDMDDTLDESLVIAPISDAMAVDPSSAVPLADGTMEVESNSRVETSAHISRSVKDDMVPAHGEDLTNSASREPAIQPIPEPSLPKLLRSRDALVGQRGLKRPAVSTEEDLVDEGAAAEAAPVEQGALADEAAPKKKRAAPKAGRRKQIKDFYQDVQENHPDLQKKSVPKKRASKKSVGGKEKDAVERLAKAPKKPVPYGANFVRQDKRFGRMMVSAGTTRHQKGVSKFFGKNGRLKPEFTRRADAQAEWDRNAAARGDCKKRRYAHFNEQALQRKIMEAAGDVNTKCARSYLSPAITEEFLSTVGSTLADTGLGEIAEVRPADLPAAAEVRAPDPTTTEPPPTVPCSEEKESEEKESEDKDSHVDNLQASQEQEESMPAHRHCQKKTEDLSAEDLQDVLRETFFHENFRPGQQEAVSSVLAYRRTLLLLATGAGKSLCYQIPAYLLREEGLTLIISPLVSLMKDQMDRLPKCLRGAMLTGQQTKQESRRIMRLVRARLVDVLYISPERLSCWAFDGCGLPPIALACIDEAHCVSEWSHNFRPDYLRLHEFLIGSLHARRLLALSATATRPTIKSIVNILQLHAIVRADRQFSLEELLAEPSQPRVQRSNLTMDVVRCNDEDAQMKALVRFLRSEEHVKHSAIVYVWRRRDCEQLSKQLRTWIKGGVFAYHGQLLPQTRSAVQDAFMAGTVRVVVATMAFGMGLDKPDIRMVIHYNIPKSLEHYVQETGRCSRDGKPGQCVALVNPKDYKAMRWMQAGGNGNAPQIGIIRRLINLIYDDSVSSGRKKFTRHELSAEAAAEMGGLESDGSWQPYYVSFEEHDVSKELGIQLDELHSSLTHFSHLAKTHVALHSKFPTELKLRFFKTDPEELARIDPLLRMVMPLAKSRAGVHTLTTAQALAALGGKPSQLSNGLFQAQGDEFSLEKANYGYMVAILKPATSAQIEHWISEVAEINRLAHRNGIDKLDAAYFALCRAADAPATAEVPSSVDGIENSGARAECIDKKLNSLIDDYFAATEDPSLVVAGSSTERTKLQRDALGWDPPGSSRAPAAAHRAAEDARPLPLQATVTVQVAKLVTSTEWPKLPTDDPPSVAHAVAQFLAGISTPVLPYKNWKAHRCWGVFKGCGNFEDFEELVSEGYRCVKKLPMMTTKK